MRYIFTIVLIFLLNTPVDAEMACELNMEAKTVQGRYKLAKAYETGHCVVWDKAKALDIYLPIAEQGYAPAQYKLGELYFKGYIPRFGMKEIDKIPPDYPKAKYWHKKAGEQGNGESQLRLAFLYAESHFTGLETDYDEAEKWFIKAANQNAGDARFRLGNFYQHYRNPPQYKKAFHWLNIAANDGNRVAQYDLASFYLDGRGDTLKDDSKWLYWIDKSAKQGNLHAQISLSKAYKNGEHGVTKNSQKSIAWAMRVANKNKSVFWYNRIGDAFFNGEGNLPKSHNRAKIWYEKAAYKNDEHAKEQLLKLK